MGDDIEREVAYADEVEDFIEEVEDFIEEDFEEEVDDIDEVDEDDGMDGDLADEGTWLVGVVGGRAGGNLEWNWAMRGMRDAGVGAAAFLTGWAFELMS